jgi:hypothetical protein
MREGRSTAYIYTPIAEFFLPPGDVRMTTFKFESKNDLHMKLVATKSLCNQSQQNYNDYSVVVFETSQQYPFDRVTFVPPFHNDTQKSDASRRHFLSRRES